MEPTTSALSSLSSLQISWAQLESSSACSTSGARKNNLRHTEARETESCPHNVKACPFPAYWDVPDSKGDIAHNVRYTSEDNWWPACTIQDGVWNPGIGKRRDYLDCICTSRIDVDLRDCVFWFLWIFQVLCENWRCSSCSVVKESVRC